MNKQMVTVFTRTYNAIKKVKGPDDISHPKGRGKGARAQPLPDLVYRQLNWQYKVEPALLNRWRMVSKSTDHNAKYVFDVRIFDPFIVPADAAEIRSYEDLDAHQGAILFEGKWDSISLKELTDHRQLAGVPSYSIKK